MDTLDQAALIAFVATSVPEQAKVFYRDVLGLSLVSDDPFALVFDCRGTMLRVQKVQAHTPAGHTALGWQVSDVAATLRGLVAKGVSPERYPFLEQDAAGIWAAPSGARIAWFRDPDGNVLSLTQL